MGVCLGFESALEYWLTKQGGEALPEEVESWRLAYAVASSRLLAREGLPLEPRNERPLHLLVQQHAVKHRLDNIAVHVCQTELPAHSFRRLGGDSLIASPELTFVQMAQGHSLLELIEIGCYLCSTFSISSRGRGYTGERQQLMSLDDLTRYLNSLPRRTRGRNQALQALPHIVELTASPKEVHLAMHYGLPPEHGGRGPIAISANQPIEIDEHAQRLLDERYLKGDLYLSEYEADLEYDSREFHTGSFRLDHTQARGNVLEAMDIKTISATQGQINTLEHFDDFTWLLEKRIGREHAIPTPAQRAEQESLFRWLNDEKRTLF